LIYGYPVTAGEDRLQPRDRLTVNFPNIDPGGKKVYHFISYSTEFVAFVRNLPGFFVRFPLYF